MGAVYCPPTAPTSEFALFLNRLSSILRNLLFAGDWNARSQEGDSAGTARGKLFTRSPFSVYPLVGCTLCNVQGISMVDFAISRGEVGMVPPPPVPGPGLISPVLTMLLFFLSFRWSMATPQTKSLCPSLFSDVELCQAAAEQYADELPELAVRTSTHI